MQKISAVIICKNEEKNIGHCLESVKWADEIVIIDSGSTDGTLGIAKKYTENVHVKIFDNFSEQKNYGLSKARNEWVLVIDADERCTKELEEDIKSTLMNNDEFEGFYIPRKTYIFGRLMKYGGHQNDKQLRLFKKSKSKFEQPIHEVTKVDGKCGLLNGHLEHISCRNLSDYISKMNFYTDLEAGFLKDKGRSVSVKNTVFRPLVKFFKQYFLEKGYRDGLEGLVFYILSSYYTFIKNGKYWEIKRNENTV